MNLRSLAVFVATGMLVLALGACASANGTYSASGTDPAVTNSDQLGPADGYIPAGDSVRLTDDVPAVTRLDSGLRDALARAAEAAAGHQVTVALADGWRSERYQQYLFDQAVIEYGSEEEATRWVKPADQSQHVHGKAVDIATADAIDWLARFGARYGLCQIYLNESWHFELATDASGTCPPKLADSAAG